MTCHLKFFIRCNKKMRSQREYVGKSRRKWKSVSNRERAGERVHRWLNMFIERENISFQFVDTHTHWKWRHTIKQSNKFHMCFHLPFCLAVHRTVDLLDCNVPTSQLWHANRLKFDYSRNANSINSCIQLNSSRLDNRLVLCSLFLISSRPN